MAHSFVISPAWSDEKKICIKYLFSDLKPNTCKTNDSLISLSCNLSSVLSSTCQRAYQEMVNLVYMTPAKLQHVSTVIVVMLAIGIQNIFPRVSMEYRAWKINWVKLGPAGSSEETFLFLLTGLCHIHTETSHLYENIFPSANARTLKHVVLYWPD